MGAALLGSDLGGCSWSSPCLSQDVRVLEARPSLPGWPICLHFLLSSSDSFLAFFVPAYVCFLSTQQIFVGLYRAGDTKATKTMTWEACWPRRALLVAPWDLVHPDGLPGL